MSAAPAPSRPLSPCRSPHAPRNRYAGERIGLHWRVTLTERLLGLVFGSRARLYPAVAGPGRLDNLDERIANSVALFTEQMTAAALGNLRKPFGIVGTLASVSVAFSRVHYSGWVVPVACAGYLVVATALIAALMVPVARAVFAQDALEGSYRFAHKDCRDFCDSIAIAHADSHVDEALRRRFARAYWNFRRLARAKLFLGLANETASRLGPYLAYWSVYVMVTNGNRSVDGTKRVVAVAAIISFGIHHALRFVRVCSSLGQMAGSMNRVGEAVEVLEDGAEAGGARGGRPSPSAHGHPSERDSLLPNAVAPASAIELRDASCVTLEGRAVCTSCTLSVERGAHTLVLGRGSGKSSVVRRLCGLWPGGEGSASLPPRTLALPQRPYLPAGSLLDAVLFPMPTWSAALAGTAGGGEGGEGGEGLAARVSDALSRVGLGALVDRFGLHSERPWSGVLSGGEMQRVALARVLVHRPDFCVLDDPFAALDAASEAACLGELFSDACGATLLVFSGRATLAPLFGPTNVYRLSEAGGGLARVSAARASQGGGTEKEAAAAATAAKAVLPARLGPARAAPPAEKAAAAASWEGGRRADPGEADADPRQMAPAAGVNALVWRRLRELIRAAYAGASWPLDAAFLVAMCAVYAATAWSSIRLISQTSSAVAALAAGRAADARPHLVISTALAAALAVISRGQVYAGQLACLRWRRLLTERMNALYVGGGRRGYYYLQHGAEAGRGRAPDNADQRMSRDVRRLTETASVVAFGDWTNYGALQCVSQVAVLTTYVSARAWFAIVSVYGIALLAWVAAPRLMGRVSRATVLLEAAEAGFRFLCARARSFGEEIAVSCGEASRLRHLGASFAAVRAAFRAWISSQVALAAVVHLSTFGSQVFSQLAVSLAVLRFGALDGADTDEDRVRRVSAMMSAAASLAVYLSALTSVCGTASEMLGYVHRAGFMLEALRGTPSGRHGQRARRVPAARALVLDSTGVSTPAGRPLVRGLSLRVEAGGGGLLVRGESGSGKTTLVRALAGLVPLDGGSAETPPCHGADGAGVLFVPQRPYLFVSTLLAQVQFPLAEREGESSSTRDEDEEDADSGEADGALGRAGRSGYARFDAGADAAGDGPDAETPDARRAADLLREVGLGDVLDAFGLHRRRAWARALSRSQEQRLGFARILYHRPLFAVCDESVSALPCAEAERLLQLCRRAGITVVLVSHDEEHGASSFPRRLVLSAGDPNGWEVVEQR